MAAGSILVDLILRTGSFETDSKRSEKALASLKKEAVDAGKVIGTALAGMAVAQGYLVKQQIDAADEASKAAQVAGVTTEAYTALAYAADLSGVSTEALGTSLTKLNKSIADNNVAFKTLGIAVKTSGGDLKDSGVVLSEVADRFSKMPDGARKAQLAVELFGKSGAQLIPLLNGGADGLEQLTKEAQRLGIVISTETGKNAEDFNDSLTKLHKVQQGLALGIAKDLLPSLLNLSTRVLQNAQDFGTLRGAFVGLYEVMLGGTEPADLVEKQNQKTQTSIKALREELDRLTKRGVGEKFQGGVLGELRTQLAQLEKEAQGGSQRLADALTLGKTSKRGEGFKDPRLLTNKAPAVVDEALANKLLENQLKGLESSISREQTLLSSRQAFLNAFNDQGLLSIKDYYSAQKNIIDLATTAEVAAIDKEVALLKQHRDAQLKDSEQAQDQGKINDLIERRSKLLQDAGQKELELSIQQTEAQRRFADQVKGINAQVLDLQEHLGAAAAIKFDQQNFDIVRRLTAEGNKEALAQVAALRDAAIGQAKYSEQVVRTGDVLDDLNATEKRIAIARSQGTVSELGALVQVGNARQAALAQMEAIVEAQEAIAVASGDPRLIQNAQKARLELESLAATVDPLADKFTNLFEDSFTSAFTDFIAGSKSAADAFKSFAASVLQEVSRLAARNVAEAIFGNGNAGGSFGNLLSLLGSFGGGSGITPGNSPDSQTGDQIRGRHAIGGTEHAGGTYLVGEKGPELFRPSTSGRILPNNMLGGARPVKVELSADGMGPVRATSSTQETDTGTLVKIALEAVGADIAGGNGPVTRGLKARGVNVNGSLPRRA